MNFQNTAQQQPGAWVQQGIIREQDQNLRESVHSNSYVYIRPGGNVLSQSQEIRPNIQSMNLVEIRKSYVFMPSQESSPMQVRHVQMPLQIQQMPIQYIQNPLPMKKSQIIQTLPIQSQMMQTLPIQSQIIQTMPIQMPMNIPPPQEQKVIVERDDAHINILLEENQNLRVVLESRISELEEELNTSRMAVEEWRSKFTLLEMQGGSEIIEKQVEVPVVDERRVRELEFQINQLLKQNNILQVTLEEWRAKIIELEESQNHGERAKRSANQDKTNYEGEIGRLRGQIEELLSRGPQIVEKVIEKQVEVPFEVIREKVIVDDRKIRELESELNYFREENRKIKIQIEEWRTKSAFLETQGSRIVEKRVEIPVEVVKYLEKIVEKRVEVPVEVVKYVEQRVEVPIEVVKYMDREKLVTDDRRVRELEYQIQSIIEENRRLKVMVDEWRVKIVEFEEMKNHGERVKRSANQDKAYFESEIVRLKKQIEELLSRGPQYIEKVVEKRVEVPIEVFREKIIVDDRRNRELEGELVYLREENRKIKISIEEWRSKVTMIEMQGPRVVEKRVEIPVEVLKYVDRRIEVPVEIVKYVDKVVEKVVTDDRRVRELEFQINSIIEENRRLKTNLDEWRVKIVEFEEIKNHGERVKRSANQDKAFFESEIVRLKKQIEELLSRGPQIVEKVIEKRVEVPYEVIKEKVIVDDRRIRELDGELVYLREENRKIKISIEEWRSKVTMIEMQGPRVVEKRVEIPVEVLKYVDRRIEVPVEIVKYVDKVVEKVVTDDRKVRELEFQINSIIEENRRLKTNLDEWRVKIVELDEVKNHGERVKRSANQDKAFFESEIVRLKKQIEELLSRGPQIVEKVIEKRVEVPYEVVKEKVIVDDRRIRELESELVYLREENKKIKISIEEWRSKVTMIEMQGPRVVEKRVEIPVEVLKYVDRRIEVPVEIVKYVDKFVEKVVTDDRKVRELEFQINSIIEENRRLKTNLDEWRVKIVELDEVKNHGERVKRSANQDKAFFESEIVRLKKQIEELLSRGPQIVEKVIEKRVEVPVDVYREKVIVDDSKVVQLSYEIERLKQVINLRQKELEDWRSKYSSLEIKISESRGKESRIFEIENRVTLLTSEIERLNVFNAKLKSDNNELYIKLSNVEGENVRHERVKQSSMQDKSMYESKIVSLANEVERLNSMVFELRGKESRLTEYENKIVMMASECERLNALVRKIKEENEGLNIKIIQFGGSDSRHLELENRISMMASENERLNGFIKKLKEENEGINARFIQLRGSGDKFENLEKVVMLSTEIERLNIIIRQYKTENERLNVMFVEFKNNEGKFCEYEEKIASEMERLRK